MRERKNTGILMTFLIEWFDKFGQYRDWKALQNLLPPTRKNFILVACMPKSGSTFFTRNLAAMMGYTMCHLSYAQKQRVIQMAKHYPWIDFSAIGIDR